MVDDSYFSKLTDNIVRRYFSEWASCNEMRVDGHFKLKRQNDNVDAATDALANSFTAYVC